MANNLGVSSYTVGGDYDTWGTKFVADMAILNKMAGDTETLSETSGPVTLTTTQCQNFSLKATGSGSTTVDYRVPDSIARFWYVNNARASGSITVRCAAGGTSVTLLAGERRLVYSDGTNCADLTVITLAISQISGLQAALDAKQASDADLTALAGLTSAADRLPYFTGSAAAALATFTGFARTLLDDADASTARSTLGLTIGTNVQAYDAELAALAGLVSAADRLPYFTGSGTASLATFTSFGRSLVDDADASAGRTTLGLGSIATQSSSNVSVTGGSISGITDLAVADGGTGASTAANARTNLGLAIGSDVQAYDAELTAIAALAVTDGNFIVGNGSTWVAESGATARTSIGLGNVDNTSDAGKPVSTAQQTALDLKADLANPTFTGTVIAGTALGVAASSDVGSGNNLNMGVYFAQGSPLSVSNAGIVGAFNRIVGDGDVIRIFGQGTVQGAISVSGSTVTYGAATIAHWGQLLDGGRIEIRRGTLLQTVDKMCEWWALVFDTPDGERVQVECAKDGREEGGIYQCDYDWTHLQEGTDDRVTERITVAAKLVKQAKDYLPRVKVADEAGAMTTAGLFIGWDADYGYTNDLNYAGGGTFEVLIQPGETPKRGDLIEIGTVPGCGRVQAPGGDPRAVVAKINAGVILTRYDDGSFTMPCYVKAG